MTFHERRSGNWFPITNNLKTRPDLAQAVLENRPVAYAGDFPYGIREMNGVLEMRYLGEMTTLHSLALPWNGKTNCGLEMMSVKSGFDYGHPERKCKICDELDRKTCIQRCHDDIRNGLV